MQDQMTFQRYELKYLLSARQFRSVLDAMQPHMVPDVYRHSSIRNLYLDTADFRLIRRSLERPVYKEKLRVRSYGRTGAYDPVFVEIKKKYASVVCKRRISLPQEQAMACLAAHQPWPDTQIGRELGYITGFYRSLRPAVFLSYERDTFCGVEDRELRVTFDTEIRYRQTVLTLDSDTGGRPVLLPGQVLMELKVTGGVPPWMARFLSEQKIFRTSFSKYGAAYRDILMTGRKGELKYV